MFINGIGCPDGLFGREGAGGLPVGIRMVGHNGVERCRQFDIRAVGDVVEFVALLPHVVDSVYARRD